MNATSRPPPLPRVLTPVLMLLLLLLLIVCVRTRVRPQLRVWSDPPTILFCLVLSNALFGKPISPIAFFATQPDTPALSVRWCMSSRIALRSFFHHLDFGVLHQLLILQLLYSECHGSHQSRVRVPACHHSTRRTSTWWPMFLHSPRSSSLRHATLRTHWSHLPPFFHAFHSTSSSRCR